MLRRMKGQVLVLATVLAVASCDSSGLDGVSTSTLDRTLPSRLLDNTNAEQDGRVTRYETWDIPHFVNPNPNLATMQFYLRRHINDPNGFGRHQVTPGRVSGISRALRENSYLTQQMNSTALVSYLLYENDQLVYDVLSPRNRFGDIVNNTTPLRSASIGKSLTSYLLGHAICEGYIDGLNARLNDWPLIQNTVYDNQRLIDLVNMRAGDEGVVDDSDGLIASDRWYNLHSIGSFARNELADTKPRGTEGRRPYHYNGLVTNVVLNYIIHKTGRDFQSLMSKTFRDKAGIQSPVRFLRVNGYSHADGDARYGFYASRYDYLRIAKCMLRDWQNDTCEGQYLKEIVERRQPKNDRFDERYDPFEAPRGYGGFFHFDYPGMRGRNILGMNGYGGQNILIDFDQGRIVLSHGVTPTYNWYQLQHQVLQNGGLPIISSN